jgi:hypothetical protein
MSPAPACRSTGGSSPEAPGGEPRSAGVSPALALALALVWLVNLPFGYWRAGLVKRSFPWLVAIHAPVPLVWLIRDFTGLTWTLATLPTFVAAYFLGQWAGGRVRRLVRSRTGAC